MLRNISAIIMLVCFGLTGCASSSKSTPETISAQQQASSQAFLALQQENKDWHDKLADIKSLEIYAPENYQDLLSSWRDAQDVYADVMQSPTKILKGYSIFSSQSYLDTYHGHIAIVAQNYEAMLKLKKKADFLLKASIEQVAYLDKIGAKTEFNDDYTAVIYSYRNLFSLVLLNELDTLATKQVDFLKQGKALEVKVMKKKYVTPLHQQLDALEQQNAKSQTPVTYDEAYTSVLTTINVITAYPREFDLIQKSVNASHFALKRAHVINHEVANLRKLSSRDYERAILRQEAQLLQISQALDNADYRDNNVEQQTSLIVQQIKSLHHKERAQIEQLQQKVQALSQSNSALKLQLQAQKTQQLAPPVETPAIATKLTKGTEKASNLEMGSLSVTDTSLVEDKSRLPESPTLTTSSQEAAAVKPQTDSSH